MTKTPREIVNDTYSYLIKITPASQKIESVRIEELRPFEEIGKKFWNVVLSFDNVGEYTFEKKRSYKKFKVTEEGEVISMETVDEDKNSDDLKDASSWRTAHQLKENNYKPVTEEETEELTVAQVCKELGRDIKIIK